MSFDQGNAAPLIMVVGDFANTVQAARIPDIDRMLAVDFAELEMAVRRDTPSVVISPLIGRTFDALDIVIVLNNANFSGLYRILVEHDIGPNAVLSDLRAAAPGVDSDFLIIESV